MPEIMGWVCLTLLLLIPVSYFVARAATVGYLRSKQMFDNHNHNGDRNGDS